MNLLIIKTNLLILLFKTTNEITVYLMLKHTQNFQDRFYFIEIIDFSRLGRALKILVSAVRFCLWPPLKILLKNNLQSKINIDYFYPFLLRFFPVIR